MGRRAVINPALVHFFEHHLLERIARVSLSMKKGGAIKLRLAQSLVYRRPRMVLMGSTIMPVTNP